MNTTSNENLPKANQTRQFDDKYGMQKFIEMDYQLSKEYATVDKELSDHVLTLGNIHLYVGLSLHEAPPVFINDKKVTANDLLARMSATTDVKSIGNMVITDPTIEQAIEKYKSESPKTLSAINYMLDFNFIQKKYPQNSRYFLRTMASKHPSYNFLAPKASKMLEEMNSVLTIDNPRIKIFSHHMKYNLFDVLSSDSFLLAGALNPERLRGNDLTNFLTLSTVGMSQKMAKKYPNMPPKIHDVIVTDKCMRDDWVGASYLNNQILYNVGDILPWHCRLKMISNVMTHELTHYAQEHGHGTINPDALRIICKYHDFSEIIPYKDRIIEKEADAVGNMVSENFESEFHQYLRQKQNQK